MLYISLFGLLLFNLFATHKGCFSLVDTKLFYIDEPIEPDSSHGV